jgi:hypothetical protein
VAAGFSKWTDHLSGYLDLSAKPDERLHCVARLVEARGKFATRAFGSKAELRQERGAVKRIWAEAFADNPDYIPSTEAEIAMIARSMLVVAALSIVRFIMKGDEVAGFMAAYPNIGRGIQRARGATPPSSPSSSAPSGPRATKGRSSSRSTSATAGASPTSRISR